ncbi:MAG: ethanolamine utilization protein EutH [Oscillospiraceae bacterium]|nr:ethanolamine utilization protein EutH [Oscillospiraceae bacterium]
MNVVAMIMLVFSMLGAIDRIIGNRFGLGKEFENGFLMFGKSALSMIGMIVISPWIAEALTPVFDGIWKWFHIDPSVVPASLFANDMGGAPLSVEVAADPKMGKFCALVVSSMMGVTISFTVPYALGVVDQKLHKWLLLGLLCGVVTVPVGCLVGGVMLGIPFGSLVYNLLPIILFSGIIGIGLLKFPDACVKIFSVFAVLIKAVITIGLAIGIVHFLADYKLIKNMATLEEGAAICLNASVVMSGAFPLVHVLSKVLAKPLRAIGKKLAVNEISAVGFLSSLASSITTFGVMNKMDEKGTMLNSAFAVSAAFVFAGHLAFTMAWDIAYLPAMIVGKLVAGVLALAVAYFLYKRLNKAHG